MLTANVRDLVRSGAVLTLLALLITAIPIPVADAAPSMVRIKGEAVGGYTRTYSGCIETETILEVFYNTEAEEYQAYLYSADWDICEGGFVGGIVGSGAVSLTVQASLGSAHVLGTIQVGNLATGESETFTIDEQFTGYGVRYRSQTFSNYGVPGELVWISRSRGVVRDATATGTIDLESAYIGNFSSGEMYFSRT